MIRRAGFGTLVLAASIATRRITSPTTKLQKRNIFYLSNPHYNLNINYYNNSTTKLYTSFSTSSQSSTTTVMPLHYPAARRDDSVVDNYHGLLVPDPYRWLEDPDAQEVKDFVQNQVNLTESVFKQCETREKLQNKLTEFYDYPKYEAPFREGDKYFYFHNTGLQPQKVLYMQDRLDAQPEVLLDPNELSEDGTVALSTCAVSNNAKYLAYALSSSGSDWVTIKIMGVQDKKVHNDTLSWVKFSGINWTHDNKGFFYCRFPAPKEGEKVDAGTETNANLNHQVYYHFLGTDQSEDMLCWEDPKNPKHYFGAEVTDDGKVTNNLYDLFSFGYNSKCH